MFSVESDAAQTESDYEFSAPHYYDFNHDSFCQSTDEWFGKISLLLDENCTPGVMAQYFEETGKMR